MRRLAAAVAATQEQNLRYILAAVTISCGRQSCTSSAIDIFITQSSQNWHCCCRPHTRYNSAPSLYLMLVCANTNTSVPASLGHVFPYEILSTIGKTRVSEQPLAIEHTNYLAQQIYTAISTLAAFDSSSSLISPLRRTSPGGFL